MPKTAKQLRNDFVDLLMNHTPTSVSTRESGAQDWDPKETARILKSKTSNAAFAKAIHKEACRIMPPKGIKATLRSQTNWRWFNAKAYKWALKAYSRTKNPDAFGKSLLFVANCRKARKAATRLRRQEISVG